MNWESRKKGILEQGDKVKELCSLFREEKNYGYLILAMEITKKIHRMYDYTFEFEGISWEKSMIYFRRNRVINRYAEYLTKLIWDTYYNKEGGKK